LPDAHAARRGVNAGALPQRPLIQSFVNYPRVVSVYFVQFKTPNGRNRNESRRNDSQNAALVEMNASKLGRGANMARRGAQVSDIFIKKPTPSAPSCPVAHGPSIPIARRGSRQVHK
jgi:hypothetical protein